MQNVWAESYVEEKTIGEGDFFTTNEPINSGKGRFHEITLFLNITDLSGGGMASVDLILLTQDPVSLVWTELASIVGIVASGLFRLNVVGGLDNKLAVQLKVAGGSTSVTFTLSYVAKDN